MAVIKLDGGIRVTGLPCPLKTEFVPVNVLGVAARMKVVECAAAVI